MASAASGLECDDEDGLDGGLVRNRRRNCTTFSIQWTGVPRLGRVSQLESRPWSQYMVGARHWGLGLWLGSGLGLGFRHLKRALSDLSVMRMPTLSRPAVRRLGQG